MPKELHLSEDPEQVRQVLSRLSPLERQMVIHQAKATLAREDFVMYCDFVHDWKLAPHQLEWSQFLTRAKRAVIVAPPEAGKSRLARTWLEWMVGRDHNIAEALIQNTAGQAGDQLLSMGESFKRDRYKMVFPGIKPTERWSSEKLIVVRDTLRIEPTVSGYGINGNYQGKHFDIMVIDDPTDPEDVLSETAMQKQRDKVKGMLADRLRADGHLFVILTRWGDNDLVATFEEMGLPIYSYPVVQDKEYPWGSKLLYPGFPQYGDEETIESLRRRKGPDLFMLTYLCESAGAVRGTRVFGDKLIKGRHTRYLNLPTNTKWVRQALGADWGTTVAHQSAMVLASKNANGVIIIRAAWMSPKGSTDEMMDKARDWRVKFDVRNVWIDRSQGSLFDTFRNEAGMQPFKGERSVENRIGSLLTLLETGRFIIDFSGEGTEQLWNQLIQYAYDENGRIIEKADDLVDACLYAIAALDDHDGIGVGPNVEIARQDDSGDEMSDAYHDGWKPPKHTSDGPWSGMANYSDLV